MHEKSGNDILKLGQFLIVAAITLLTNHLIDVKSSVAGTEIGINGNLPGWISSLLICGYMLLIWLKFEYYLKNFEEKIGQQTPALLGTCAGCLLLACAGLFSMHTSFGNSDCMHAVFFFGIACIIIIICDLALVLSRPDQEHSYWSRITSFKPEQNAAFKRLCALSAVMVLRAILAMMAICLAWNRSTSSPVGDLGIAISNYSAITIQFIHIVMVVFAIALSLYVITIVWLPMLDAEAIDA